MNEAFHDRNGEEPAASTRRRCLRLARLLEAEDLNVFSAETIQQTYDHDLATLRRELKRFCKWLVCVVPNLEEVTRPPTAEAKLQAERALAQANNVLTAELLAKPDRRESVHELCTAISRVNRAADAYRRSLIEDVHHSGAWGRLSRLNDELWVVDNWEPCVVAEPARQLARKALKAGAMPEDSTSAAFGDLEDVEHRHELLVRAEYTLGQAPASLLNLDGVSGVVEGVVDSDEAVVRVLVGRRFRERVNGRAEMIPPCDICLVTFGPYVIRLIPLPDGLWKPTPPAKPAPACREAAGGAVRPPQGNAAGPSMPSTSPRQPTPRSTAGQASATEVAVIACLIMLILAISAFIGLWLSNAYGRFSRSAGSSTGPSYCQFERTAAAVGIRAAPPQNVPDACGLRNRCMGLRACAEPDSCVGGVVMATGRVGDPWPMIAGVTRSSPEWPITSATPAGETALFVSKYAEDRDSLRRMFETLKPGGTTS